jgi:hypothetical protein
MIMMLMWDYEVPASAYDPGDKCAPVLNNNAIMGVSLRQFSGWQLGLTMREERNSAWRGCAGFLCRECGSRYEGTARRSTSVVHGSLLRRSSGPRVRGDLGCNLTIPYVT